MSESLYKKILTRYEPPVPKEKEEEDGELFRRVISQTTVPERVSERRSANIAKLQNAQLSAAPPSFDLTFPKMPAATTGMTEQERLEATQSIVNTPEYKNTMAQRLREFQLSQGIQQAHQEMRQPQAPTEQDIYAIQQALSTDSAPYGEYKQTMQSLEPAMQYTPIIPQDVKAATELVGGPQEYNKRLENLKARQMQDYMMSELERGFEGETPAETLARNVAAMPSAITSVLVTPAILEQTIRDIADVERGIPVDYNSLGLRIMDIQQNMTRYATENDNPVAAFLLNSVLSTGQMLLESALMGGVGRSIMAPMMLFATSKATNEALSKGNTPQEALMQGTVYGILETLPEVIPLGMLEDIARGTKNINSIKRAVSAVLKVGAAEGVEELITEITQGLYDYGKNGANSDLGILRDSFIQQGYSEKDAWDKAVVQRFLLQPLEAAGQGFLVGATLGGGTAIQTANQAFYQTQAPQTAQPQQYQDISPEQAGARTITPEGVQFAGQQPRTITPEGTVGAQPVTQAAVQPSSVTAPRASTPGYGLTGAQQESIRADIGSQLSQMGYYDYYGRQEQPLAPIQTIHRAPQTVPINMTQQQWLDVLPKINTAQEVRPTAEQYLQMLESQFMAALEQGKTEEVMSLLTELSQYNASTQTAENAPETILPQGEGFVPTGQIKQPAEIVAPQRTISEDAGLRQPSVGEQYTLEVSMNELEQMEKNAQLDFDDMIERSFKGEPKNVSQSWEDYRTLITDRFAALERLEKDVYGKVQDAETSLYKGARMISGSLEYAERTIRKNLFPIINMAKQAGYTYRDLGNYALAMHARDVNAEGLNSGWSNEQIQKTISEYESSTNFAQLERARQALLAYNRQILDILYQSGRITDESYNAMTAKWQNYMPLHRVMTDEKVGFDTFLSEKISNPTSPIYQLKGSTKHVYDPITSIMKNTYRMIESAAKTEVGARLIELARTENGSQYVRILQPNERVDRKNVVIAYENGQAVRMEVDPNVYKAMQGMNQLSSNLFTKILSKPAQLLRAGATLDPVFSARNPIRDIQLAYITNGFNPITDFARGLASVIGKDEHYDGWVESFGAMGTMVAMDRQQSLDLVKEAIRNPVQKGMITVFTPKGWINALRTLSNTMEEATRVGMYRKALRKGETRAEAAYQARDLMDFARSGTVIRQANRFTAFMNANVQGMSKVVRAIKANPLGVMGRMIKGLVLPTIIIKLLQYGLSNDEQKKVINDAPDWLRDTFWLIPLPGTDYVLRVPKPFDVAIIPNAIDRFMDYTVQQDDKAFDGYFKSATEILTPPILPTGITPIIEGIGNVSLFRQSPIIPQREEYDPRSEQYDVNTSELARHLAALLEPIIGYDGIKANFTSPRIIDNLIRGYTGGLGNYGLDVYDYLSRGVRPSEKGEKPAKQFDLPVLGQYARGFTVNQMSTGKSMEYVYDRAVELENKKKLTPEEKREYEQIKAAKKELSEINKEMRAIQNDRTMGADIKRGKLLKLNEERNEIARRVRAGKYLP